MLVPRKSWAGCQKCWKAGVPHNGYQAVMGRPCYIRFPYCDEKWVGGGRLVSPKPFQTVRKDKSGRWLWSMKQAKKAPSSIKTTRKLVSIAMQTYIRDCPYVVSSYGTKSGFVICTTDHRKWKVEVKPVYK